MVIDTYSGAMLGTNAMVYSLPLGHTPMPHCHVYFCTIVSHHVEKIKVLSSGPLRKISQATLLLKMHINKSANKKSTLADLS